MPTFNPDAIPEIEAWLSQMGKDGLFSGAVLIAHKGEILLSQGYGLADREQNTFNTSQTRFRLGSITKQFTAMAILMLQVQGKLHVEDTICNYVSDCPETWGEITIDHLLTHTSGIPNFTAFSNYMRMRATPSPPEQTMARFKDLPLDFQPGEKWSYSNSGYIILGHIIEQVSGQTYEAFLQQSILSPLNLSDTGYDHNSNGLAVGYTDQYSNLPADFIDMSIPHAAGALYSTVEDLYLWDQALYTDALLPSAQLDQMFAAHAKIPDSAGWAYGYGWVIGLERGRKIMLHGGGIAGFATMIVRYPNEQICLILLSNVQNKDLNEIQNTISQKLFGDKVGRVQCRRLEYMA
jgi:CubicO group peptidase (beta-lactamase class C family)